MRRPALGRLATALLAVALTAAAAAAAQSARMTFGSLTIEGQSWQGGLRGQGPWEWKGPVTVRASGLTMTCDKVFKLWPTPDYRDFERVEASGHIRIDGRYRTADETEWEITGQADAGTYDAKTR